MHTFSKTSSVSERLLAYQREKNGYLFEDLDGGWSLTADAKPIGVGTFGAVYKLDYNGSFCAVKVISVPGTHDEAGLNSEARNMTEQDPELTWPDAYAMVCADHVERVKREYKMLIDLHQNRSNDDDVEYKYNIIHATRCEIKEYTRTEDSLRCYDILIQMEFIETTLLALINEKCKTGEEFTTQEVLLAGRQICGAMKRFHGRELMHRDIKPGNILLQQNSGMPQYIVSDFGEGRSTSANLAALTAGRGTIGYMCPTATTKNYSFEVDVYSLGKTLYHMATLKPPGFDDVGTEDWNERLEKLAPCLQKIIRFACPEYENCSTGKRAIGDHFRVASEMLDLICYAQLEPDAACWEEENSSLQSCKRQARQTLAKAAKSRQNNSNYSGQQNIFSTDAATCAEHEKVYVSTAQTMLEDKVIKALTIITKRVQLALVVLCIAGLVSLLVYFGIKAFAPAPSSHDPVVTIQSLFPSGAEPGGSLLFAVNYQETSQSITSIELSERNVKLHGFDAECTILDGANPLQKLILMEDFKPKGSGQKSIEIKESKVTTTDKVIPLEISSLSFEALEPTVLSDVTVPVNSDRQAAPAVTFPIKNSATICDGFRVAFLIVANDASFGIERFAIGKNSKIENAINENTASYPGPTKNSAYYMAIVSSDDDIIGEPYLAIKAEPIDSETQNSPLYTKSMSFALVQKTESALDALQEGVLKQDVSQEVSSDTTDIATLEQKANSGDKMSQRQLANYYFKNETPDYKQALNWYEKAAAQGDDFATYRLGYMHQNGYGVEQNLTTAREWYEKAAALKNSTAQWFLGSLYENGTGVPVDEAKAVEYYAQSAANGNSIAQYDLALMYQAGRGGLTKDIKKAAELFLQSAEQGYSWAQERLGSLYRLGGDGFAIDYEKALLWYQKSAEQGYAPAQRSLGYMYEKGLGMPAPNGAKAVEWYHKAVDQNNMNAQFALATLYEDGECGLPVDAAKALELYQKSADQGYSYAQNQVGYLYQKGSGGLPQNTKMAIELYEKAAAQGNTYAMYNLGHVYQTGLADLPIDEKTAIRWYQKAAELGNAFAQNNLGIMYKSGLGGLAKDEAKAVELYRLAADQGNAFAQVNLGRMYESGFGGLEKDETKAVELYQLSADQGYHYGQSNLGFMYESGLGGLPKDIAAAIEWYKKAATQGNEYATKRLAELNA